MKRTPTDSRRALTFAVLVSLASSLPSKVAIAQETPGKPGSGTALATPAPPPWKPVGGAVKANPVDVPSNETEIVADADSAIKDGFVMDELESDHVGEKSRDLVAREFMPAIGAEVGRKMPLEFSFDLMDLTGSGYNSLILWPRIYQLYPKDVAGGPLYIYDFDGKAWHLAAKGYAMLLGVRPHMEKGKPTGAMDLAFVSDRGYTRYVYDKAKDTFAPGPR